jgi:hypothetical protein
MSRLQKLALLVGFLALAVAVAAARRASAALYEPSIYADTPTAFWAGVGLALVIALALVFGANPDDRRLGRATLALAGLAGWTVPALPVIRGYYFYGTGDSLSHLGFAAAFLAGKNPADLLHPGLHIISLAISGAAGVPIRRAMLLAVAAFFALFLVFVPLCVREFAGNRAGLAVGTFAGVLLLPINNIGIHVIAHPSSEAVMFFPLVLFAMVVYFRRGTGGRPGTAAGALLTTLLVAMVFVHPQESLNVIVILVGIVLLQRLYRRVQSNTHRTLNTPIADHRSLVVPAAFMTAWWLVWSPRSPRVQRTLRIGYQSLFGGAPPLGTEVNTRTSLLPQLGGSVEELFVKLFLGGLVFSMFAGLAMLVSAAGVLDDLRPSWSGLADRLGSGPAGGDRNGLTAYVAVGFLPLLGVTGFVFFGAFGDHFLRWVGFLMMLVTVIGAAALARWLTRLTSGLSVARVGVALLFALLLPLSVLSVHPSPWIYQPTDQVTEQQFEGYETAFDQRAPEVAYAGIRSGPRRYVEAMNDPQAPATEEFPGLRADIPPPVFGTNLTTHYEEPRYVPVTVADRQRELQLYEGLRYGPAGFRTLRSTPGVHRVQANDEFELYLLGDE